MARPGENAQWQDFASREVTGRYLCEGRGVKGVVGFVLNLRDERFTGVVYPGISAFGKLEYPRCHDPYFARDWVLATLLGYRWAPDSRPSWRDAVDHRANKDSAQAFVDRLMQRVEPMPVGSTHAPASCIVHADCLLSSRLAYACMQSQLRELPRC